MEMTRKNPGKKSRKSSKKKHKVSHHDLVQHLLTFLMLEANLTPTEKTQVSQGGHTFVSLAQRVGKARSRVPRFIFGTQEPEIRISTVVGALTPSGGGVINQVVSVDPSGNSDWASGFAAIFDEYKVMRATLHIVPYMNPVTTSTTVPSQSANACIVVVDYDNATAIASVSAALQYDTKKIIYLGVPPHEGIGTHQITFRPQGMPDLQWYDTGSITIPGYFKFYNNVASSFLSVAIADFWVELDVKFRQVQ